MLTVHEAIMFESSSNDWDDSTVQCAYEFMRECQRISPTTRVVDLPWAVASAWRRTFCEEPTARGITLAIRYLVMDENARPFEYEAPSPDPLDDDDVPF